jgi:PPOX class probable F420-dependent enzyme
VPCCFVLDGERPVLYTPLDDKPKRDPDPLTLARIRDIAADPRVTILVDRWDEDWTRLAWLRCDCTAALIEPTAPEHPTAVAALRAKYPQYAEHRIETHPLIRVTIERAVAWGALERE